MAFIEDDKALWKKLWVYYFTALLGVAFKTLTKDKVELGKACKKTKTLVKDDASRGEIWQAVPKHLRVKAEQAIGIV